MRWHAHPDGSFDLVASDFRIARCYPAFDSRQLRPQKVSVRSSGGATEITYYLSEGTFCVKLWRRGKQLVLSSSLRGMAHAPGWVQPLAGRAEGASRLYRQGLGFAGPSGLVDLTQRGEPWSYESYAVTALAGGAGQAVAVTASDHGEFLHKCAAHNRLHRSGLINRHVDAMDVLLEAGFSTEAVPVPRRGLELPDLIFVQGTSAWDALHAAAVEVGRRMGARTWAPPCYHWCSWYYQYHHMSEQALREYLDAFRRLEPPVPLQTIQIDAGYYPHAGDWLEANALWPGGMETAFRLIRDAGYRAGIWIAPFMVGNCSRLYREHPDWILRDLDGRPVTEWRFYSGNTMWGMSDKEYYVLDTSHPEAFEYLRQVFRTFRAWGATFYKTDFMDWGLKDSTRVRRHRPGRSSVQHFRELLAMIRAEIGEESYWLACIAPYGPFIGFADGMRVANDNGIAWSVGSTMNMIQESEACQYFNNVWWQNDPDVIYLRDRFIRLSDVEIKALAFWQGILGGSVNTSEPLHELPPERLRLWRFLRPSDRRQTARMPYWCSGRRLRVAVRDFPELGACAAVALNSTDQPVTERLAVSQLWGRDAAFCYEWGPEGARRIGHVQSLVPELEPHSAALYYLVSADAPPPEGLTLGGAGAGAQRQQQKRHKRKA